MTKLLKILAVAKDIAFIIAIGFLVFTLLKGNQKIDLHTSGHQISPGVAEITTTTTTGKVNNTSHHIKPKHNEHIISTGAVSGQAGGHITHSKSKKVSSTLKKHNIKEIQIYWHDDKTGLDMPIGVAIYSPKRDKWITKAYNLNFRYEVVETIDKKGAHHHTVSLFAKPKNLKQFKGEFPLHIDTEHSSFVVARDKTKSFDFWNPTLSGGVGVTNKNGTQISAILKFNFMNYGSKQIPSFEFLSPFVSITPSKTTVGIEPISYNIGDILPLIKDTKIGIGIDNDRKVFGIVSSTF